MIDCSLVIEHLAHGLDASQISLVMEPIGNSMPHFCNCDFESLTAKKTNRRHWLDDSHLLVDCTDR